ncbi:MAG: hypothetical protein J5610_00535 [Prevotella sp.]|nr:hypothetical protein [Prevotella sp.]
MKRRNTFMMWLLLSACWLMAGCSVIDDDLSDCNQGEEFHIDYQLRLITNMTTELQTQLTTVTEVGVADALKVHLKDIFSDFAHDIDLSFYDTEGDLSVLEHKSDIMNANHTSYDLTLPMHKYMHLAVANISDNAVVSLADEKYSNTSMLRQSTGSTLASHGTGLFTARLPMEVLSGVSQTFYVKLYMANSAAALVVEPRGHTYKEMKVYATGFASQFYINDSTYVFDETPPLIKADKVDTGNDMLCYCSVNFPSRDNFSRAADDQSLWQFKIYLTKEDGKTTESVIYVREPLKAGELKIIKAAIDDDGGVRPTDSRVGVSVTLDWNSGGEYESEL